MLVAKFFSKYGGDVVIKSTSHFGEADANTQNKLSSWYFTESSSGRNQFEMMVLCEPCKTYPPMPKTALPTNISQK